MSKPTVEDPKLKFLTDDYGWKVGYLKDHFTRVWARFNYFLSIQSALFGAAMLSPEKFSSWIPIFAALLCIPWYIFGVQDRYLVALYRKQIEKVVVKIKSGLELSDYYFVGQTEDIKGESEHIKDLGVEVTIYQWRNENFSTTKLAAIFPLFMLAMWIVIYLFLTKA